MSCHEFTLEAESADSCKKCGFDGHTPENCHNNEFLMEQNDHYFIDLDNSYVEKDDIPDDYDQTQPVTYSYICNKCCNFWCVEFKKE